MAGMDGAPPVREWTVQDTNGQEWGPYTLEELRQYVAEGRILGTWQVSDGVSACTVDDVLGLRETRKGDEGVIEKMIPYKNQPALVAYYVGLFAFIPLIGVALGIIAVIYGIQGLRLSSEDAEVRGRTHAWVGIICGGFWGLVQVVGAVMLFFAATQ